MATEQTPTPDGATPCPDAVAGLQLIARGTALLQAAPTSVLSDHDLREAVAGAAAARARLDAGYLHLLAGLDTRDGAVPGAATGRGGATFLIHRLHTTPGQAARDVAAAHTLDVDGAGITPEPADTETTDTDTGAAGRPDPAGVGLPLMGAALAAGQVTLGHVEVAVRCLSRVPARYRDGVAEDGLSGAARIDAFLTQHAREVSTETLRRIAQALIATLIPPDDTYAEDTYDRRYLSIGSDPTGMTVGSFALDPAAGARLRAVIAAIVKSQRLDPRTSTHTPDGPASGRQQTVLPLRDERTAGQRRADALDQLCHDALHGTSGRAAGAQVVVVASPGQLADALAAQPAPLGPDGKPLHPPSACSTGSADSARSSGCTCSHDPYGILPATAGVGPTGRSTPPGPNRETRRRHRGSRRDRARAAAECASGPVATGLAIDLSSGAPIEASTLALHLCNAVLTGITLDEQGAILDHGRSQRYATAAQVRALTARDQGCIAPGCGLPPVRCDAHHVIWWRHGGTTDIDNLVLLCARHHAAVHAGIWQIQVIDGVPWMIPPAWADPTRTPRRNPAAAAHHHARALGQKLRNTQLHLDLTPPDTGSDPPDGAIGDEPNSHEYRFPTAS